MHRMLELLPQITSNMLLLCKFVVREQVNGEVTQQELFLEILQAFLLGMNSLKVSFIFLKRMIKKKLIVGITRLFFLFILWQSGSISFEIGKEKNIQETPPHEIVITTTGIENIPGTLLISPNTINRDTRAKTTEETPHLR